MCLGPAIGLQKLALRQLENYKVLYLKGMFHITGEGSERPEDCFDCYNSLWASLWSFLLKFFQSQLVRAIWIKQ
ncbi:hypothetical protein MRB53_030193 [Persea americana]|uniref:Uncharacterized protein n=1 Tax=Persea americana TaxID=3435 RepID=A0ACC2KKH6_PERAE|nr:hypothetical protein MRB53_030193 [Persea americana]